MRIVVAHNAVEESDGPDAKDVLFQVQSVCEVLERLGHETLTMACTLDLDRFCGELSSLCPDIVFNLVESLAGKGRLIHLVPSVMDALGVPYSGSSAETILVTSNKVMAKYHMRVQGLPTPDGIGMYPGWRQEVSAFQEGPWIIKSVWEHASIGLDESSIVKGKNREEIQTLLADRSDSLGGACFAERFIDGREFNISLLGGGSDKPLVLPPAEILFENYDDGQPRIVDYQAKWDETSFAFVNTPRCFEFDSKDGALLETLNSLARKCWSAFGLRGYARVDFRVDRAGQPWILEVNANPCLSPDAGFAAALNQGGIAFSEAVRIILEDIPQRKQNIFSGKICEADCFADGNTSENGSGMSVDRLHEIETALPGIVFRTDVNAKDPERIRDMVRVTGYFSEEEVAVAEELVLERLNNGPTCGYQFLFAEHEGRLSGYTCYGQVPCTAGSYDLYWIAVHPHFQRRGLGRRLMLETENRIKADGGRQVYVETSQRFQYASTRAFYESLGYRLENVFADFYAPGDGKAIYSKKMV